MISFFFKSNPYIDEIRFGATLADVAVTTPSAPVADPGGPYPVGPGGSITLDGSNSTVPEGTNISLYEWDLDGDGDYDENVTGETVVISYEDLRDLHGMTTTGDHDINLRITDDVIPAATNVAPGIVRILGEIALSVNGPVTLGSTDKILTVVVTPPPSLAVQITLTVNDDLLDFDPIVVVIAGGSSEGTSTLSGLEVGIANISATGEGYTEGTLQIEITETVGTPGDVNGDGCVNVADLLTVRNALGLAGSNIPPGADVSPTGAPDGIVNVADLLFVRNRLGEGPGCP